MPVLKGDKIEKIKHLPTGIDQLDIAIGGGIPIGVITEISGRWSSGKSTLAEQIIAVSAKRPCLWYDTEYTFDSDYAKNKIGIDTSKLDVLRERVAEDGLDYILEYSQKQKNALVVIDSVGGIHPREEVEKSSGERTIGAQAGLIARFCRKIVPLLSMNKNTLIVLNHEYQDIMGAITGRPAPIRTAGGRKLEYHRSLSLRIVPGKEWTRGDTMGFDAVIQVRKDKFSDGAGKKIDVEFERNRGFVARDVLFEQAVSHGTITKEGRVFFFGKEKLGMETAARQALQNHKLREKITNLLTTNIKK